MFFIRRCYIATCLKLLPGTEYANCGNTGTLAGDLAEMTKIESCIIQRDFLCVLIINVLLNFNFMPITNSICKMFINNHTDPGFPRLV